MRLELPKHTELPLTPAELADLAVKAKLALEGMQAAHDAYQREADQIRADVAKRYQGEAFEAISPQERRRVAEHETASRATKVRQDALATMNSIAKERLGPIMTGLAVSKKFYRSSADTILRMTLDNERRARLESNLSLAGPVEIWHAAVTALQSADAELAAAIIQALRILPMDQRPFPPQEFAARFAFPPHEKAVAAINRIDADIQGALLLWKVVQNGRASVGKIEQIIRTPEVKEASDDAVQLSDLAG